MPNRELELVKWDVRGDEDRLWSIIQSLDWAHKVKIRMNEWWIKFSVER